MKRRSFFALLATLIAWPFTRAKAHEIAENGSFKSEETGERRRSYCRKAYDAGSAEPCPECRLPRFPVLPRSHACVVVGDDVAYAVLPIQWTLDDMQWCLDMADIHGGLLVGTMRMHIAARANLLHLCERDRRYTGPRGDAVFLPIVVTEDIPPTVVEMRRWVRS